MASGNAANRLCTNGGEKHFRNVVADQGDGITFFQAEFLQAQSRLANQMVIVIPGVAVPAAELFFPQGDLVPGAFYAPAQQLWNGK
jgi:hypothetical protein